MQLFGFTCLWLSCLFGVGKGLVSSALVSVPVVIYVVSACLCLVSAVLVVSFVVCMTVASVTVMTVSVISILSRSKL